jgi:hypothetical protein
VYSRAAATVLRLVRYCPFAGILTIRITLLSCCCVLIERCAREFEEKHDVLYNYFTYICCSCVLCW